MTIVETNNGRKIACSKVTFEVRKFGFFAQLYRDDGDGEYEYETIHVSTIEKIYASKEA